VLSFAQILNAGAGLVYSDGSSLGSRIQEQTIVCYTLVVGIGVRALILFIFHAG